MWRRRLVVPVASTVVCVEDVKCVQRYPWNGLVDIEYTIACDDPEAEIYVNPVGFNGDTGLTVFPTHFTGDGATNTVKVGRHTMVFVEVWTRIPPLRRLSKRTVSSENCGRRRI